MKTFKKWLAKWIILLRWLRRDITKNVFANVPVDYQSTQIYSSVVSIVLYLLYCIVSVVSKNL